MQLKTSATKMILIWFKKQHILCYKNVTERDAAAYRSRQHYESKLGTLIPWTNQISTSSTTDFYDKNC